MVTEKKSQKIPILMYHSIAEQASEKFRPFTLSPALFAEQIAYLHERGYAPLTVSQCIAAQQQNARQGLPERPVILTFDDGFADFFSEALPVLSQYHFPATLYIATAYVNGTSHWLKRSGEGSRRMLTWEQVREIAASGIECGAHSHHHLQLDTLSFAEAREEILTSKQLLEEQLAKPVGSFAYPHGYHSMAIKEMVRQSGFTSACTVKYTMCSTDNDPFALPRLFVSADTSVEKLEALLAQPIPTPAATIYGNAKAPLWRFVRRYAAPVQEMSK
jgi:peptidoglycan/xylan/chitin deacetylase (PgdA/CDA1 family)